MLNRIEKLTAHLDAGEAYYLTDEKDVRYFTGFAGEGTLLLSKNENILFTDSRYLEAAGRCAQITVYDIANGMENGFSDGLRKIYISENKITYAAYKRLASMLPDVAFLSDNAEIAKARMRKDTAELDCIRRASNIAEKAYEELLNDLEGITEKELAFRFEMQCRKNGAEALSFEMIVASGTNSSMPHAHPTDKKLAKGDFITFDFGCVVDGYCSDMTRTVALGYCSDKQREVYEIVRQAQLVGLENVRAGALCKAADAAARKVIADAGYGAYFGHSLGHGVGLDVHELPNLSPKSEFVLEENMVVSVEPGIYLPGQFGVRIEDLVIVLPEKCEILTKNSKELRII